MAANYTLKYSPMKFSLSAARLQKSGSSTSKMIPSSHSVTMCEAAAATDTVEDRAWVRGAVSMLLLLPGMVVLLLLLLLLPLPVFICIWRQKKRVAIREEGWAIRVRDSMQIANLTRGSKCTVLALTPLAEVAIKRGGRYWLGQVLVGTGGGEGIGGPAVAASAHISVHTSRLATPWMCNMQNQ